MRNKYLLSIAVLTLASSVASAGYVQPQPVVVTLNADGSGSAIGDMLSARNALNDIEFIGCGVRKSDDGAGAASTYGFCQARSASSEAGFCSTDNAELISAIQSIADYSFVTFSWRRDGTCSLIGVSTQSFYLP